jgi:DNA-binding XRE family transcriptional regulator
MDLKLAYSAYLLTEAQKVVETRKELRVTQKQMAFECAVCEKTIQNFESFKHVTPYLVWAYKQVFKRMLKNKC